MLAAYLLSNGAEIVVDKFGNTPLHDCAIGGFVECARLLIASGCDASLRDNQEMTSADLAEAHGHKDFANEIRKFEKIVSKRKFMKLYNYIFQLLIVLVLFVLLVNKKISKAN